ncbi:hypothetical protein [Gimesia sp.]|uniref:hypothetical protein n=1 Tax=Gimesia sp. TaxID=2024833 RepID=UPI003A8FA541
MKQFLFCLIAALMVPAIYGCSSEMSEEDKKESVQAMEEEGKKMEELLPAKID